MTSRSDIVWPVALTATALVVRLAFVMAVQRHALVFNDALFYHIGATSLADHNSFTGYGGNATVQWPPGYSFLLSLVYRVTSGTPYTGELVNAVIGAMTVPVLYMIAKRLFGRTEAIIAAGILAVFPGQILWTDVLVSETIYTFLLVVFVAVLVLAKDRWYWLLIIGALAAVSALTRGEGLFLLLIAFVVLSARFGWTKGIGRVAIAGLICVAGIAPWTIRNYRLTDRFVPISANDGATLYSGHNPMATGAQTFAPQSLIDKAHRPPGVEGQVVVSSFLRHEAIDWMVHHPGRELKLIPLKLLALNRGDSYDLGWVNRDADLTHQPIATRYVVPISVIADFAYYTLLTLTLVSIALFRRIYWRDPVLRGVLAWFLFSLFLYGFLYYGNYRYRDPLEPLMILVSAPLIAGAWRQRKALRTATERALTAESPEELPGPTLAPDA